MCLEFERFETIRREMEKQEALKKSEDKAREPGKPDMPDRKPEGQPVPA